MSEEITYDSESKLVRCEGGCGSWLWLSEIPCLVCSKIDARYRKEKLLMQNQTNGGNR